jgi:hypothetical protein
LTNNFFILMGVLRELTRGGSLFNSCKNVRCENEVLDNQYTVTGNIQMTYEMPYS